MTPSGPTSSPAKANRAEATIARPAWSDDDLAVNPHDAPDKADRVRNMFAAIARRYDLNNRLHSFGRDQHWRRTAVRLGQPSPEDHVLDAATGTGDLAEAFADVGVERVVGVDFTEPMLDIARQKAVRRHRPGDAATPEYHWADVTDLPFDDASFDIVSIAFGIRNVDHPARAIAEFRRVLRPGGRLVVLEFSQPRNRLLRAMNNLYCRHIMPWSATLIARDRSGAYRYLPRSVDTFLDRQHLADLMEEAGFTAVTQHEQTFGVCTISRGIVEV